MVAAGDPVESADITGIADYTTSKPLVRLVVNGTQSIPDNTQTAIQFAGADDIDTHGFHDPASNNTRITPTVAGYYDARGTYFTATLSSCTTMDCNIRKNGSSNLAPAARFGGAAGHTVTTSGTPSTIGTGNAFAASCQALVSMNGSTDYVELIVRQDSAGAINANASSQFSSAFELIFERPL